MTKSVSKTTLVTESLPDITQKEPEKKTFKTMTMKERILYAKEVITVEPIIASYVFASVLCTTALYSLQLEKACKVNAGFNETICTMVLNGEVENISDEFNVVQNYITNMQSWQTPVQSVMPLILVLFLGSYSDRHHMRKPFMLLPLCGEFFAVFACILCVVYMDTWPVEALGVSQTVLSSFFGGQTMLVMAIFSYIADVSSVEMRTTRIGVVQVAINAFLLAGQALSAIVFEALGYIGTFCVACAMFLFAVLYGFFWIKEKQRPTSVFENGVKGCFMDAFNPSHAVETIGLLFKKKKGTKRTELSLLLVIFFISSGVLVAEFTVMFLYCVKTFSWTPEIFNYYLTVSTGLYLIGAAAALPLFTQVFKFHDLIIMAISFVDKVIATVIIAFAKTPVYLYVATVIGIIQREATIGIRSFTTKIVAEDDLGKVQSLFGICEAAAPAIMAPIFNQLYSHTQTVFSGAMFLLGAALFAVDVLIALLMYFMSRKKVQAKTNNDKNGMELENGKHPHSPPAEEESTHM